MLNLNQYFLCVTKTTTTTTLGVVMVMIHLIGCTPMSQAAANVYVPIFKSDDSVVITGSSKNISMLDAAQELFDNDSLDFTSSSYSSSTNKPNLKVPQTGGDQLQPSSSSPSPSPPPPPTFTIAELTQNFEQKLKSMRNTELGIPFIQEIFDTMDFVAVNRNDSRLVSDMAARLTLKLSRATRVINETRRFLRKNLFTSNDSGGGKVRHDDIHLHTIVHPCRPVDEMTALDQHYDKRQIEIKNWPASAGSVDQFATLDPTNANYTANRKLLDTIRAVNYSVANLRQVYFLSRDDWAGETTCRRSADDAHLRYLFASTIKQKNLMIIIDHGSSLNADQLELTKTFATNIIGMLNERDLVSIVAVADQSTSHYTDLTASPSPLMDPNDAISSTKPHRHQHFVTPARMYSATMDNKGHFLRFVDQLNGTKAITNHSLAFSGAFAHLHEINANRKHQQGVASNGPIHMMYISRGLVSPLTDAPHVLQAIANGQSRLDAPVIINTCAIVLDEKRVMYEKQFLKDVAQQNYTKYNLNVSDWLNDLPYSLVGRMFVVNRRRPSDMLTTSVAVFGHWLRQKSQLDTRMVAHLPVYVETATEKDMVVSVVQPWETYGVVGVDMYVSDLAEDVIFYNKFSDSYAFVVDLSGYAVMHPSYPRPTGVRANPYATDIKYLEQTSGFVGVRQRMLSENSGTVVVDDESDGVARTVTYSWHRAHFYVVCIATIKVIGSGGGAAKVPVHLNRVGIHYYQPNDIVSISGSLVPELVYHRVDLIPIPTPLCRHFKQLATMESITLFLSASSFTSPFLYLKSNREFSVEARTHNAKSVMAYIKDTTNLLANPGLLPQIRNDVTALFHVMSYLKKRHIEDDTYKNYIIRRYAATMNGVVQIYPGCLLSYDLEPMRRPWFVKAMQHTGQIVMTEPYLDAGGAGYIVTISHTIYEGKSNALHSADRDSAVAIISVDVTLGFLYKLVLSSASYCGAAHVKCFLMEDRGWLLAHPSILEPATTMPGKNTRRPLEHITHKESYMANDILYHRQLVEKKLCTNYPNRTRQRFYQFNTTLRAVLTNRVHGERTKYQMTAVPGTNVFVALLNSTCDGGAFCPCSTVDRICLNCNRMEQTNCECPCECPLAIDSPVYRQSYRNESVLSGGVENAAGQRTGMLAPVCDAMPELLSVFSTFAIDMDVELQMCVNINCDAYGTQHECLGIMGCEWCQVDVDGETFFALPFCTQQSSCFNGVLGSSTPYGDGDLGSQMVDSIVPPAYSAIGPVSGVIIALCLVIGFAMYCYRQNLDTANEQLYAAGNNSMHENQFGMPLSRFDYDDINPHDDGDLGGNSMNRNLLRPTAGMPVADISPYRMNAGGYRAPPPNAESDHGYSTMTPREDSEHLCFALAEPLIGGGGGGNKRISMSDSASINTSVSSPTNHQHHCHHNHHQPLQQYCGIAIDRPKLPLQHQQQQQHHNDSTIMGMTSVLPTSPHHIQAPVTVHHPMETV